VNVELTPADIGSSKLPPQRSSSKKRVIRSFMKNWWAGERWQKEKMSMKARAWWMLAVVVVLNGVSLTQSTKRKNLAPG
jgi:hypothetical protein